MRLHLTQRRFLRSMLWYVTRPAYVLDLAEHFNLSCSHTRRRLRRLERKGLVMCASREGPYLSKLWRLTDAGNAAIDARGEGAKR